MHDETTSIVRPSLCFSVDLGLHSGELLAYDQYLVEIYTAGERLKKLELPCFICVGG